MEVNQCIGSAHAFNFLNIARRPVEEQLSSSKVLMERQQLIAHNSFLRFQIVDVAKRFNYDWKVCALHF